MRIQKKWFALLLILLLLALVAVVVLSRRGGSVVPARSETSYMKLFSEVLAHVKTSYVEEVEPKKLVQGAIDGMLASLDPHSNYLPPEPFKEMNIQISGSFGGVGIELTIKDDKLTVVAPIEETPAERAGIKPNDHIARIDKKFTKGMNINDAVKLMRGEPGTPVTLTILRENVGKPFVFPLTRAVIKTKSLRARSLSPGYGYIRIAHFQARTGEDFRAALAKLHGESGGKLKGLIIDLRNNPGGLVDQAAKVADAFIGEGLESGLIVYTQGRTKESRQNLTAFVGQKEPRYPIVVLMNGGSASASEILAGALQDHKRAVILGTQSFGKGSVQSIFNLPEGAGLKLTTARYYTPNGRSIQAKGITPDIIVPQLKQGQLSSSRRAGHETREQDLDNHLMTGGQKDAAPVPHPLLTPVKDAGVSPIADELSRDYQLQRAYGLLQGLTVLSGGTAPSSPAAVQEPKK